MYQNQGATATTQPIVLANMPPMPIYLSYPQPYNCPNCKNQIVTRTEAETGTGTWIFAGALCLMGCWCGCQLIPFFVDKFKDVKHFCPNCNHFLGIKKVM